MRIEEINNSNLSEVLSKELYILRLRFIQLWNKNFEGNDKTVVGSLNRNDLLNRYKSLVGEMNARKMKHTTDNIDRAAFKKAMVAIKLGVDFARIGDIVIVPDYLSIGGSFAKNPDKAEDVDIIIREDEDNRDEGLELKLSRIIQEQIKKNCHFIYSPTGPHSTHIPLFDKVLRIKQDIKRIEIKEGIEKSSEEYYEGLDKWNDAFEADYRELTRHLVGDTVLSLGCGSGRLEKRLSSIYKVEGVDNNDTALKMCKDKKLKVKKVDLDNDRLPYEDNSWDNVIGLHVLEHLDSPQKAIGEAQRVAKKKVIFICPLGERQDATHSQQFNEIEDFEKLFDNAKVKLVPNGDNTAVASFKPPSIAPDATKTEKDSKLQPFGRYDPPKPAMAHITEAFKFEDIEGWVKDRWPVDVEEKLNGFRCIAEKSGDKVKIWTEGRTDRTKVLPDLIEILSRPKEDFILDMNLGIDREGKPLPRIKLMTLMAGDPELEEEDTIKATCFDLPYWGEDLHEKPLTDRRKLLEEFYDKYLKDNPHFALTNFKVAKNAKELQAYFNKLSKLPQSEGVLIKSLSSKWDTDGTANDWAKIKIEAEIKVMVFEKIPNKAGGYNYRCGVLLGDADYENVIEFRDKKYVDFGNTFNTTLSANPGDILTIGIGEIIPDKEKKKLQWLGPRVLDVDKDRKEPYFANQVVSIAARANILQKAKHGLDTCMECSAKPEVECLWAEGMGHAWFCMKCFEKWATDGDGKDEVVAVKEIQNDKASKQWKDNKSPNIMTRFEFLKAKKTEGNIDYKLGDTGKGVLQLHIMGIEENKIENLKKVTAQLKEAKHNLLKLKMLLKQAIGEQGAHLDMRLVRKGDDYFEGGEIMLGNISGLDKLKKLEEGGKLRFGWKVPHAEEPTAETIRGPVSWMEAGKKLEIFPPGEAGATTNTYGVMLLLDEFTFEMTQADEHAKKLKLKGCKLLQEGTYLMAYVPVADGRVWMVSKLKEDEVVKLDKFIPIFPIGKGDEHIICGIVYEPDVEDAQGDSATEEEIRKAAYQFMEEVQTFKVNHKGKEVKINVLENYLAPVDFAMCGQNIRKGSWLVTARILDKNLWQDIKKGRLTGYSMAGYAKAG